MSESPRGDDPEPTLDDVVEPFDAGLPRHTRRGHAGEPQRLDDDQLAEAADRERADAGLSDYAPEDVPEATEPLPEDASEAADRAQQGPRRVK